MGLNQYYAGYISNKGSINIERCNYIGLAKTTSANDLITDSAASGTAIATGYKTNNNFIGMTPDSIPVKSILHYAEMNNKSTGLVAVCTITHATPASFIAHHPNRNDYESIASDFLKTDVDVFIGGGYNHFGKRTDAKNLIDSLEARNYKIATNMEEVMTFKGTKLAGLIYEDSPPSIINERFDMLYQSTLKAINILNKNENGFFLMIEASQIDWEAHSNEVESMVQEIQDFDHVIGMVLDFAEQNKETLVIITSDHETGGFTITGGNMDQGKVEGVFTNEFHTGTLVPIFAFGPQSETFAGIMENTDIFKKMFNAFGFKNITHH